MEHKYYKRYIFSVYKKGQTPLVCVSLIRDCCKSPRASLERPDRELNNKNWYLLDVVRSPLCSILPPLGGQIDRLEGDLSALRNNQLGRTFEIVRQRFDKILIVGLTKAPVTTSPPMEPANDATKGTCNNPSRGAD